MTRILILKLWPLGGILMATPLLRALKTRWPECRITWLVSPGSAAILEDNPFIDELIVFDFNAWRRLLRRGHFLAYWREARSLRHRLGRYEAAVNLTAEKWWTAWFLPAPVRIGLYPSPRIGLLGRLLYTHPMRRRPAQWPHKTRYWLSPADLLGAAGPHDERLVLTVSDGDSNAVGAFLGSQPGYDPSIPLVIFHPGTSAPSKCWPPEYYAALAAGLAGYCTVVLTGGPSEQPLADAVLAALPSGTRPPIIAVGRLGGIRRTAALVARSAAVVTGDTSVLHIASALAVPLVGIYGSTRPGASAPLTGPHILLYDDTVSCAPCDRERCPLHENDYLRCQKAVTPPQVLTALQRLLAVDKSVNVDFLISVRPNTPLP